MEQLRGKKRSSSEFLKQEPGDRVAINNGKKTKGRVKIKMEFIDNKLRRYTTFSKRKTGIMKKAYELSTLTGTQVMLLVASETGHVYTFATKKLQPMITSEAGKALIQTCLNTPDEVADGREEEEGNQRMCAEGFQETDIVYEVDNREKGWEESTGPVKDELEEYQDLPGSDEDEDEYEVTEIDKPTNLSLSNTRKSNIPKPTRYSEPVNFKLQNLAASFSEDTGQEHRVAASGSTAQKITHLQPDLSVLSSLQANLATSVSSSIPSSRQTNIGAKIDSFMLQAPAQLPTEVIAQLGYTSLLAHASNQAAHQSKDLPHSNSGPLSAARLAYILPGARSHDSLATAVAASLSRDALSAAASLSRDQPPNASAPISRETLAAAAASSLVPLMKTEVSPLADSDPTPENLSLHDKNS